MKFKKVVLALLISVFLVSAVGIANAFPNLPAPPTSVTVTIVRHNTIGLGVDTSGSPFFDPAHTWFLDVSISGVGTANPPFDVQNTVYSPGWCVDRDGGLFTAASCYLFSSISLPSAVDHPELTEQNWNKINYILNHIAAGATTADIQQAIWAFCDAPPAGEVDPPLSAISQGMVNAANNPANNAGTFVPSVGQNVAVIVDPIGEPQDESRQIVIIVLTVPSTGGPGLTPGFWKHNVGIYLTSIGDLTGKDAVNGAYSNPTGSTLVSKDTMPTWLASHFTEAELIALYNDLTTIGGGAAGAATRDGAANVFNVEAGLSPGPPWI